jgi:ATP-dependent exoDNAse (exonuclease V) alpha subunit
VTLAPNREGQLVTSQRGRVQATSAGVDGVARVVAVMDDGHPVVLAGDELDAGRVDYGYALTVHRMQGGTVDVGHRFEDGGGRELAYVALSRGRQANWSWVVAVSRHGIPFLRGFSVM